MYAQQSEVSECAIRALRLGCLASRTRTAKQAMRTRETPELAREDLSAPPVLPPNAELFVAPSAAMMRREDLLHFRVCSRLTDQHPQLRLDVHAGHAPSRPANGGGERFTQSMQMHTCW
jgi:hypothetical protein